MKNQVKNLTKGISDLIKDKIKEELEFRKQINVIKNEEIMVKLARLKKIEVVFFWIFKEIWSGI